MAYTKTVWVARQGTGLNKFTESERFGNTVVLTNTPDSITVQGTQYSPEVMNHIEKGIEDAHILIADEAQARKQADDNLAQTIENRAQMLSTDIAAESRTLKHEITEIRDIIADLIRLIESGLGPLSRIPLITEEGFYLVTDEGDYLVA